jgi:hypothetical protein
MKKLTLPPRYKMMKGMGARLGLSSNRTMKPVEQVGGMIKEMDKMSVGPKLKPLRFKL